MYKRSKTTINTLKQRALNEMTLYFKQYHKIPSGYIGGKYTKANNCLNTVQIRYFSLDEWDQRIKSPTASAVAYRPGWKNAWRIANVADRSISDNPTLHPLFYTLSDVHRKVIVCKHKNRTLKEVAKETTMSVEGVHNIVQKWKDRVETYAELNS